MFVDDLRLRIVRKKSNDFYASRVNHVLQTYPADYVWPVRAVDQYRLVGNSVPPALACAIGRQLAQTVSNFASTEKRFARPAKLAPLPEKLQAAILYTMREERANGASRKAAPKLRRMKVAAG
ncbi:DNA cytosine methyltransferase [Tianweitania sediminis]|uniref:DNA cytosine methyltransferase n=1 Tax=Tianweitania sediminis TaxID=1502156 RepID=A0A8J7RLM0_9HYPH|nr:DNA cytosine methyltransferase [Tianweitania sediminis]